MSLLLESGRNTMGFCGMVVSSARKADSDMSEVLLLDTKTKHRIASVLLEDHIILDGKLTGNLWFDPGLIGLRINGTIPLQPQRKFDPNSDTVGFGYVPCPFIPPHPASLPAETESYLDSILGCLVHENFEDTRM